MRTHHVTVHPSADRLPVDQQLAWHIAAYAASRPAVDDAVATMVRSRLVDSLAVSVAGLAYAPVANARAMALAHPRPGGAQVVGMPRDVCVHAEWAAWANGTALRQLDFNDTFLAAEYAHPSDAIPPLVAVAQQTNRCGGDLERAIAVAYEIHVALAKSISLHAHRKDHVAHLCPAMVAGIGTLLGLPAKTIYQAVNQAVHLSFATRQSRKGEISSWKAFAPAYSGKLAIEAVDRAMRGEGSPAPIYEGEESVLAAMLAGAEAAYDVALPEAGAPPQGILETYPKAHAAEYQAQAWIDLAFRLRRRIDPAGVREMVIRTSDHTHFVIGSGANDPQKYDPQASRETLDHSVMYIVAVALEDGAWHHEHSYSPERAARASTLTLWRAIRTEPDAAWTRRYHHPDPGQRAFGGTVQITLADGTEVTESIAVADAHPNGARPWRPEDYEGKLRTLASGWLGPSTIDDVLAAAWGLAALPASGLHRLTPDTTRGGQRPAESGGTGIFDWA